MFELKSFAPKFPYGQLLRYISRIWDLHEKQKKPIPIVLPIVLYHGESDWEHRPLYSYLTGDTELYDRFIPLLENLTESDRIYIASEEGLRVWESICCYVFAATTIKPEEIMRAVQMLLQNAQEAIMTTAQRLMKQGEQRGLERGVEEGLKQAKQEDARRMLEEGLDTELTIRVTGLSKQEVEALR